MRNLTIMGVVLIQLTTLISACGSVKKIEEKEYRDREFSMNERVEVHDGIQLETRSLSRTWAENGNLITALIESDSAIVFDPSEGFSLKSGRVLYQQAKQELTTSAVIGQQVLKARTDSLAERSLIEEEEMQSTLKDKERKGMHLWLWVVVGVCVVFVLASIMKLGFGQ